jgi:ABC-type sugar transport system substrate-binding protein
MIEPQMRDTAEFKSDKSSGWNICFSNAGNNNPWRQNGLKTMEAAAKANSDIGMDPDRALDYLQAMLTITSSSEDTAEGVAAFAEKRAPEWKGR